MNAVEFDIQKKIQAAAILTRLEGGRIDKLRLLKLLYLADRESLRERGCPIIGGRVAALDKGPLHCDVYDMIQTGQPTEWSNSFRNDGHSVVLASDPGDMKLSSFEIDKLTLIFERFKDLDTWDLVEVTHTLPEWKSCWEPGTSTTISFESQLRSLGFSECEIKDIIEESDYYGRFSSALDGNSPCKNSI